MNPTEPGSSPLLRPVTWRIWLAWVFVSALVPVMSTISETAVRKPIARSAEHPFLIEIGLLSLAAFATLAPPVMQGLVLKCVVPRLSARLWCLSILLSTAISVALSIRLHQTGFRSETAFAVSALAFFIPACALGVASKTWRTTLLFFTASIVAECASTIVAQFYNMIAITSSFDKWTLNGLLWTERFHILAVRAGVGAIWGATTAMFVVLMTRRSRDAGPLNAPLFATGGAGGFVLLLIAPFAIAVLAPFVGYLVGPNGLVIDSPDLRRAISSKDSSKGEMVLVYSHDVAVPAAPMLSVATAPDGRSAIIHTVDRRLVQVDLATGRVMREVADPLTPRVGHSIAWSPDGRYFALRSVGAEVSIPNTPYKRYGTHIRLYALPDLTLVGEFWNNETSCFGSYARRSMLFAFDGGSLWLACGQSNSPQPDDLMAIQINVPAMQVVAVRRFGKDAEAGEIRDLNRIDDSIWEWQFLDRGNQLRVRDLVHDRDVVTVTMPHELIGGMTWESGEIDENTVRTVSCGAPPGAVVGAVHVSLICRTLVFGTQTGALIDTKDRAQGNVRDATLPVGTLSGHGLRLEALWDGARKTNELVVRDSRTDRQRQRIVSIAQRPIEMSADGVWLITRTMLGDRLRFYRMHL